MASTATATSTAQPMRRAFHGGRSAPGAGECIDRITGTTMSIASTTNAITPRNTQRQPTDSATMPAIRGPISDGITQAAAKPARMRACSTGGYTRATITYNATVRAPPPRPCTSRPATKTPIVGARPAMSSPTTNKPTDANSALRGLPRSDHAPASTIPTTLTASGPANANAYSDAPSSSRLMVGMIVVTASASNADSMISAHIPMLIHR